MNPNSKCCIITPVSDQVEPITERAIFNLVTQGYPIVRLYGNSNIAIARSFLASKALSMGYEELMWIDSDTEFCPEHINQLRSHDLPIVSGVLSLKGKNGGISISPFRSTKEIKIGEGGGVVEIKSTGLAFTYTKRRVYEDIKRACGLPDCKSRIDPSVLMTPYFLQILTKDDDGSVLFLSEDNSFCEYAKFAGYKIYADTSIRLSHIGKYGYSIEDISGERERFNSVTLNFRYQ